MGLQKYFSGSKQTLHYFRSVYFINIVPKLILMEQYESSIFEVDEAQLVLASQGKRFFNMVIDGITYGVVYQIFSATVGYFGVDLIEFFGYDNVALVIISSLLISLSLQVLFFTLMEALFKGKSLGKLITGTRAVNEDGSHISAKTAFLRSLSKMVPFDAFSALGSPSHPWHDRWTRTYVIDEKQSIYPESLFEQTES
jgi:uncharacterized RDD family membrane protein YckC